MKMQWKCNVTIGQIIKPPGRRGESEEKEREDGEINRYIVLSSGALLSHLPREEVKRGWCQQEAAQLREDQEEAAADEEEDHWTREDWEKRGNDYWL